MKLSLSLAVASLLAIPTAAMSQGLRSLSPGSGAQGDYASSLPITFNTYLGAGYDTNPGNRSEGDSVAFLQGSINAEWVKLNRRSALGIGATVGGYYYLDSPESVEDDILYNARLDVRYMNKINDRVTLRNYAYVAYEIEPDLAIGETANRRGGQYLYFYDQLSLHYKMSNRLTGTTRLKVTGISYEEGEDLGNQEDRINYEIGQTLGLRLNRSAVATANYDFGVTDYTDAGNDAIYHRFSLGLNYDLSRSLSSSIAAGATFRDGDLTGTRTTPYVRAALSGQINSRLRVNWVNRLRYEDSESGIGENIAFRSVLGAQYQVTRRLELNGSVSYVHSEKDDVRSDFLPESFTDDVISVSLGMNYQINRWLGMRASYAYYDATSDIDSREYDRHIISAGLTATWN